MTDCIAVLGCGRMGTALAREAARVGRAVCLGSRDPCKAVLAAEEVRSVNPTAVVRRGTYAEAVRGGDLVFLAVPFPEASEALRTVRDWLPGRVVVDVTNPMGAVPCTTSGAEAHAAIIPHGGKIVAAWKTNYWTLLDPAIREGVVHDVFICGDSETSKLRVSSFVSDVGFRPVDCGGLVNARILDAMVALLVENDRRYSNRHRSSWRFVP
ncbi:MAG TPA: NAD(P)-binding domain-containing protein [Chthonomonadales bacterium]|nr:NAD(P)-binding domain-containing protein [Chthonomonadales bacterium]